MKLLKTISINLITFAVLLVIVNWASGVYVRKTERKVNREDLPNYHDDREHARQVFRDYYSVKHQYEPFVGWKSLPYRGQTVTISVDGERIHLPEPGGPSGGKVVRFFGGSTMWGEGADDQHTIPALFNKLNPEFKVYNHAQLAYNTRQELDALISLYSRNEKADIVIFYDGVNDAAFLCPSEIEALPAHRLVPMYREKLYRGTAATAKDLAYRVFVENIIGAVNRLSGKGTAAGAYDCVSKPGKAEQIAEIMMRNWEMANELVTARGGRFIAILQPAAYIGKPQTGHLTLDPELGRNFAEVYRHLQQKIRERNYPWIFDLSDRFDGSDYIYIDFCHVSPNGNQIMAEQISSVVNRNEDPRVVSYVK